MKWWYFWHGWQSGKQSRLEWFWTKNTPGTTSWTNAGWSNRANVELLISKNVSGKVNNRILPNQKTVRPWLFLVILSKSRSLPLHETAEKQLYHDCPMKESNHEPLVIWILWIWHGNPKGTLKVCWMTQPFPNSLHKNHASEVDGKKNPVLTSLNLGVFCTKQVTAQHNLRRDRSRVWRFSWIAFSKKTGPMIGKEPS